MGAEVWLGVGLRPPVEDLCECGGLSTPCGQVLLQNKYEDDLAFGREVHDILGDESATFGPSGRRDLRIVGRSEADLGNMDRVMTVRVA